MSRRCPVAVTGSLGIPWHYLASLWQRRHRSTRFSCMTKVLHYLSLGNVVRCTIVAALGFGALSAVDTWRTSGQPLKGVVDGLVLGTGFGILWTLVMSWFFRKDTQVARPDFGDEQVIVEGPAHHLRGVEAVGGYLWVTDRRVHFMAHSVNIQSKPWHCSLAEIADVRHTSSLLGIIDKGLSIDVAGSGTQGFVVYASRQWVDAIRPLLGSAPRSPK